MLHFDLFSVVIHFFDMIFATKHMSRIKSSRVRIKKSCKYGTVIVMYISISILLKLLEIYI